MTDSEREVPPIPDSDKLGRLESFDPAAFQSEDKSEQKVCHFILMLALVYNDFRDLLWAFVQLNKYKPPSPVGVTANTGQYSGLNAHLNRLIHSLVFDLAELIKENSHVLEHPLFRRTMSFVRKESRQKWEELVAFANGKVDSKQQYLAMISKLIRHNIAAHYYQPKFLGAGYDHFFSKKEDAAHSLAYISRGSALQNIRFYFADAAVAGCFGKLTENKLADVRQAAGSFNEALNMALYDIVQKFIQTRGFAWTPVRA